jgi:plastocyanin
MHPDGNDRAAAGGRFRSLPDIRSNVMRKGFAIIAFALAVTACGGSDNSGGNPAGPTAAPPGATVINIVGDRGVQSFSPDPATVAVGETVVWHNVDSQTHRVVFDDRGLDTGDIAPGRFSEAMTFPAPGSYHCSLHPFMTGTVRSQR